MRIYSNAYELMSEMGRELNSYGLTVKPKTYQNQNIEGKDEFITKEIICQQYCLTRLPDPEWLFIYTHAKEWADAEFEERINPDCCNPGEAWKLRRDMWEQFLVGKGENIHFDYTYNERIQDGVIMFVGNGQGYHSGDYDYMPKLQAIISLLINDNDTRKAVLAIYGSKGNGSETEYDHDHYAGDARIPCSMYYDFLIRENAKGEKQLNICYHQRSSDFCMHFGDDVYLAWKLMEHVAKMVGVKPGYLYHTIDSLHAYKKDWHLLNTSIEDIK